ncbi:hypothetical protein OPQ81_007343 [Rhizoctonia solani]|nr:hypothetical protein OPQ81_007343 [Rhizoctonia solani]
MQLLIAMNNLQLVYPPDAATLSPGCPAPPLQSHPIQIEVQTVTTVEEEMISGDELWELGRRVMDLDLDDDGWQPLSYEGWSEEQLQRLREAWGVEINLEELLATDITEWN